MSGVDDELREAAAQAARHLHGRTLACAESFTAGLVTQAFAAVDGSGEWLRGGIIAYQRETKAALLGVDASAPLVSADVAEQMARGVAACMNADVAMATTGAAGPTGLDGMPPGTVVLATCVDGTVATLELHYDEAEPASVVARAAHDAVVSLAEQLLLGCNGSCREATGTPHER